RHTRFSRDWSSDVCSSDLVERQRQHVLVGGLEGHLELLLDLQQPVEVIGVAAVLAELGDLADALSYLAGHFRRIVDDDLVAAARSEERRVGKECRSRWWAF